LLKSKLELNCCQNPKRRAKNKGREREREVRGLGRGKI